MSGRISYLNPSAKRFVTKDSRSGQFAGGSTEPDAKVVDVQHGVAPNSGPIKQVLSQRPTGPVIPEGVVSR